MHGLRFLDLGHHGGAAADHPLGFVDVFGALHEGERDPVDPGHKCGFEVGAISIIKGTKNLAAAKALVDWSITKEAGDLNVKLSNRGSTRTDVASAPGAPSLTSVKLVNYDRQWATDNKTRLLQMWQTTVGL